MNGIATTFQIPVTLRYTYLSLYCIIIYSASLLIAITTSESYITSGSLRFLVIQILIVACKYEVGLCASLLSFLGGSDLACKHRIDGLSSVLVIFHLIEI